MSVSMAAARGKSERSIGGKESAVIQEAGREAWMERCVADAVKAKLRSVVVASGIRWPIPAVASIATCRERLSIVFTVV